MAPATNPPGDKPSGNTEGAAQRVRTVTGTVITRSGAAIDQWPAVPSGSDASRLALMFLLGQTQYEPAEKLLRHQLRQAHRLAVHAELTVPFYRGRLAAVIGPAADRLTMEAWRRVPILKRADIQGAGGRLHATTLPAGHGRTTIARTSGSSGEPIAITNTEQGALFFQLLSLRYHLWFKRDFRKLNLDFRALAGGVDGVQRRPGEWGAGYVMGPSVSIDIGQPIPVLFEALMREDPYYLQAHPFTLLELVRHSERVGVKPRNLREARSFGELLRPEVRETCRRVWGVPVTDNYSATEVGIMALQCPEAEHYHVQAESVLLELLREDGTPCAPGETGRVVVTDLQNFAMPLIRYDIGDFATAGEGCVCGRTLPVIADIAGRDRGMLVLPDGARMKLVLRHREFAACGPISQFQIIQTALDALEVRLVVPRPWTAGEEALLRAHLQQNFRYPYSVGIEYVSEIPRSAGGKYEDFVSRVGGDR
jgi:phenylacetate-CoA ligase